MKNVVSSFLIFVKKNWQFVFLLAVAFFVWIGIIFSLTSTHVDERSHNRQIHRFMNGKFELLPDLTTIPGYHLAVAGIAESIGLSSLMEIRLISLMLACISLFVFFLVARELGSKNPLLKTLQFVFMPLSFVYFPLVYTDIFSLTWILLVFYFSLKRRYTLAAIFSLVSLLIRQNNIVWIVFFWAYIYLSENNFKFSIKRIISHMRQTLGYVFVFIAFAVFLWINNGIAVGDRGMQQIGFHTGNIYFLLVVVGIIFWPTILFNIRRENIKFRKLLIFGFGFGAIVALSFVFFTPQLHEYNLKMRFLKNVWLSSAYANYYWMYAAAVFLGYLTIFQLKLDKKMYVFYPFVILGLVPSMMIDERYYIVPLVFVLLFRKEFDLKREYMFLFYLLLLSLGYSLLLFKMGF